MAGYLGHRMDKRITGIIRWLERCRNSYKSGAIESALMDAECARADLEDLRLDVWSHMQAGYVPQRRIYRLASFVCSFLLLPILMVMATPSRIASVKLNERLELDVATPITQVAQVVAEPESKGVEQAQVVITAVEPEKTNVKVTQTASYSSSSKNSNNKNQGKARATTTHITGTGTARVDGQIKIQEKAKQQPQQDTKREIPSFDTMLSLFQTGQTALRGEQSPVKIIK